MKKRDIEARTFEFACRILKMDHALSRNRRVNRRAMNQLVDAAMSVGANLEEARGGHSRADFHSKVRISLKEARESHYWLRLVSASSQLSPTRFNPLIKEANEIVAILTTIAQKTNPRNPTTS
jgi:four helix bundle protein